MRGGGLGPGREFDLIRRFLEGSADPGPEVIIGPGDDCALIRVDQLAISTDLAIEDVHFRRDWLTPEEIGYRATAAALSDLAATAARPIGVLVSLALADPEVEGEGVRVMEGVREAVEGVSGTILGGDLVRTTGPLTIDIVALGSAPDPVLRSGAEPGDEVWVTGYLGGAATAVESWLEGREPDDDARAAYARPEPRIREALWLGARGAMTALLDISDGIAGDLRHLATASGVGILVEPDLIPIHEAALRRPEPLRHALEGGEDYELALTMPPGVGEELAPEFTAEFGVSLHRIGRVIPVDDEVRTGSVVARRVDGRLAPLEVGGFEHFHQG